MSDELSKIGDTPSLSLFERVDFTPCNIGGFLFRFVIASVAWRSGYCYSNQGECNLNQSKDDSFVERVARNNI